MSRDLLRPAGMALDASVTSAFDKIGRVLSRDALRLLDQMRETIGVRAAGGKLQAPAAEHVALIQQALLERRRVHEACDSLGGMFASNETSSAARSAEDRRLAPSNAESRLK